MRKLGVYLNGLNAKGLVPLDEVLIANVTQLQRHLVQTPSAQGVVQLALTNANSTGPWTGVRRFTFDALRHAAAFPFDLGRSPTELSMVTAGALSDFLEELFSTGDASASSVIFGGHSDGATRVIAWIDLMPNGVGDFVIAHIHDHARRKINETVPAQLLEHGTDDSPTWLDPTELTKALATALGTSDGAGKKMEVIGLDACCASSVELANALAPYARFLVSSEIGSPIEGWDYAHCLTQFALEAGTSRHAAESLVDGFKRQHQSTSTLTKSVALSAIALEAMPTINSRVANFVKAVNAPIAESLKATLLLARTKSLLRDTLLIRVDMISFFREVAVVLGAGNPIAAAAQGVCQAVQGAVVENWYQHGEDGETTALMGLSICFPTLPGDFDATWTDAFSAGGGLTGFWAQTGWDQFLIALRT